MEVGGVYLAQAAASLYDTKKRFAPLPLGVFALKKTKELYKNESIGYWWCGLYWQRRFT
jgi:hypothetical protein